jgi:hypothetical protein
MWSRLSDLKSLSTVQCFWTFEIFICSKCPYLLLLRDIYFVIQFADLVCLKYLQNLISPVHCAVTHLMKVYIIMSKTTQETYFLG